MIDDARQREKPVRRRPPLRAIALGLTAVLALTTLLAYRHYTDPARIRGLARDYLQQFTHGRVSVGAASFSFFRDLRLFDVTIDEAPDAGAAPVAAAAIGAEPTKRAANPVFACRQLQLRHDPWQALVGRLHIENVIATSPSCAIVYDITTRRTNLSGLLRRNLAAVGERAVDPPTIELREARVHVVAREADGDREIEDLQLSVRGRRSSSDSRVYDIVWQRDDSMEASGHSQIDLRSGDVRNVRGGLPYVSIDAVMLAVDAKYDGVGAWVNLLGLDGTVRARDYDLTGSASHLGVRSATIELREASLSIPVDDAEEALPRDQRYLRFTKVDGTVIAAADRIQADFTGELHGSRCRVSANMRGGVEKLRTLQDAALDVRLFVEELEVPRPDQDARPEEKRFIERWKRLRDFYEYYDPQGRFDLQLEAAKEAGAEGKFSLRLARLTSRGGNASVLWAPYRCDRLSGTLEVSDNGVFVRQMRGHHDGGWVSVDGWFSGPDRCADGELLIRGESIPVDEKLYAGLPPRFAKAIREFEPCGRFDFTAELRRAACVDDVRQPFTTRVEARFSGMSGSYRHFPYPIVDAAGEIVVEEDRLVVSSVRARTPDLRGTIEVAGDATFGRQALESLSLTVLGEDVGVDGDLLGALNARMARTVVSLGLAGRFDVDTELELDPATRDVAQTSQVLLRGATIRPADLPVPMVDTFGWLRLEKGEVQIQGLRGWYGDGQIQARGHVRPNPTGYDLELAVDSVGVEIDDELRAGLPAPWRAQLGDWRLAGPVDLNVRAVLGTAGDETTGQAELDLELNNTDISHPMFPIPFSAARGMIHIAPGRATGLGLAARYGRAPVHLAFESNQTDTVHDGRISLTVTSLPLDDAVRDVLPKRLRPGWDRIAPGGSVDLHMPNIRFSREGVAQAYAWQVDGEAVLRDVDLHGVHGVRNLTGSVTGRGTVFDRRGGLVLSGEVARCSLSVQGRLIENLKASWSAVQAADGSGRLALKDIEATLFGGTVIGELALESRDGRTEYNLGSTLQGVPVAPLMGVAASNEPADAASEVRGKADVSFQLSGTLGQTTTRRGVGGFELREGYIHRLPLMLAIWGVLNANLPSQDNFDSADAKFFVVGQTVDLQDIRINGGSLELIGKGTMALPDMSVDLELVSVNKQKWGRVPVLTDFLEGASKELIELHVTGPLSRPNVQIKPLRGIGEELQQLFQKRKPPTVKPASG